MASEYFWAVVGNLFGIIGAISTVVWAVEMVSGFKIPKLPPRILLVIAFCCFTIAQYQAWKVERKAKLDAQKDAASPDPVRVAACARLLEFRTDGLEIEKLWRGGADVLARGKAWQEGAVALLRNEFRADELAFFLEDDGIPSVKLPAAALHMEDGRRFASQRERISELWQQACG